MKTINVKWTVTNKRLTVLEKVAKSWGKRSVAGYIKMLVETKIGKV